MSLKIYFINSGHLVFEKNIGLLSTATAFHDNHTIGSILQHFIAPSHWNLQLQKKALIEWIHMAESFLNLIWFEKFVALNRQF